MTTLDLSHQRAVGDLLQAERSLRQKSEETIRAMREALKDAATRFDGERLESLRRGDPSTLDSWSAADWRAFFNAIPARSQGWGNVAVVDEQAQRKLQKRIDDLQTALEQAEQNQRLAEHSLQEEKKKNAAVREAKPTQSAGSTPVVDSERSDAPGKIPNAAIPALAVIIEDAAKAFRKFSKSPSTAFSKVLSGGGRSGGDRARAFQRYQLILYLVGYWRLTAVMEIEQVLGDVVHVSSGSGSIQRIIPDMEKAGVLTSQIVELDVPSTALKLCQLSAVGGRLYQSLFSGKPYEDDWSRLIRLREGEGFPPHEMAAIAFAMHARKRGWATQVRPKIKDSKLTPDILIMRGNEKWYVSLVLDGGKIQNLSALNGGQTVFCAAMPQSRARLIEECKTGQMPGMATDLETLVSSKYRELTPDSALWLESWP